MSDSDLFLQTIEAIYAGGIESDRISAALEATSRLLGGIGATLEVIDKPAQRHIEFCSAGLPPFDRAQYVEHFAALNPRIPFTFSQRAGDVGWDRQILDEAAMTRDPFYAEFLGNMELRYFISTVLEKSKNRLAAISIQRTHKQGHVGEREIALMFRLAPHFQRARDMNMRLSLARGRQKILENSLDWLRDGIALLRADSQIIYANRTLQTLERRGDKLRIVDRTIEFIEPQMRRRFAAALKAVASVHDLSTEPAPTDFVVPRDGGLPAYTVSLRPLFHRDTIAIQHSDAAIMLLIRDPLERNVAASNMLRELFGLTQAEAQLAQALCAGINTRTYARQRQVSITTVYTHLRRIREKTGCKSVAELVAKLGELDVPLRLS